MSQHYAVIDKSNVMERSKFAHDYVFYGTAKQALAEVERILSTKNQQGARLKEEAFVNVYRIKKSPDVTAAEDLKLSSQFQKARENTVNKIEDFINRYDIPRDKKSALIKLEEIKKQAAAEGLETVSKIATALSLAITLDPNSNGGSSSNPLVKTATKAVNYIRNNPKSVYETAKRGAIAKATSVKGRLLEYFEEAQEDAAQTSQNIEQDALNAAIGAVDSLVGPNPDALKLEDGRRVVRLAYLLLDNNAAPVSVATLRKAAKPAARKKPRVQK